MGCHGTPSIARLNSSTRAVVDANERKTESIVRAGTCGLRWRRFYFRTRFGSLASDMLPGEPMTGSATGSLLVSAPPILTTGRGIANVSV